MLKYVSTDAITPQLQNLALTGSTLSHRLTYNIAGDTLTISCHYNDCASAPIVIALPEKTSDLFTKIEVEGTCCEPGSITYSFSYASAREIILEYQAELSNSYYNYSLNDIADFLASNYLSAVYFEINSNNPPRICWFSMKPSRPCFPNSIILTVTYTSQKRDSTEASLRREVARRKE